VIAGYGSSLEARATRSHPRISAKQVGKSGSCGRRRDPTRSDPQPRGFCKQEVAGSIPVGSTPEVPGDQAVFRRGVAMGSKRGRSSASGTGLPAQPPLRWTSLAPGAVWSPPASPWRPRAAARCGSGALRPRATSDKADSASRGPLHGALTHGLRSQVKGGNAHGGAYPPGGSSRAGF
jgi:hypothetical protein